MFAAADNADRIDVFGQISCQFAFCELVADHDLIHGKRERGGKSVEPCLNQPRRMAALLASTAALLSRKRETR